MTFILWLEFVFLQFIKSIPHSKYSGKHHWYRNTYNLFINIPHFLFLSINTKTSTDPFWDMNCGSYSKRWCFWHSPTLNLFTFFYIANADLSGRFTLYRLTVGHLRRQEALKYGVVNFYGLSNFFFIIFNFYFILEYSWFTMLH